MSLNFTFGGFTDEGRRAYGLNTPVILKEYNWKNGCALLARKDERWLLAVAHNGNTKVLGINEDSVNIDAKNLGMKPVTVAQYEAEGMLRKRGWDG